MSPSCLRASLLVAVPAVLAAVPLGCRGAGEAPEAVERARFDVRDVWAGGLRSLDEVPQATWRADGKVLLYDPREPEEERTIQLLDPGSGTRAALVDARAALASLVEQGVERPEGLAAPEAFDRAGRLGLYLFEGDLWVLDLEASRFVRLTATPEEEESASFSPDGTKLAFVRANDLWVIDVAARRETRLTDDGSDTVLNGTLSWVYWEEVFGRQDTAKWWAPDSRSLAFLRTDESPVGVAHFVGFEEPYPELIRQRYPKAGTANPLVRVGVARLDGGPTTWVELPREHEYVARVAWTPDGARLAVQTMTRDQRRLDLALADPATGAASYVLTETDPAWVNVHDDLTFLRDGRHFLWVSERSGHAHLYLYTLEGELVRQITSGDWSLASDGGDVFWLRRAIHAVDEDGGWIHLTALVDSSLERQLYRVRLDGSGLQRTSRRGGTHQVSFSPDARLYLDTWSTLRDLPSLSLHAADGELLHVVAPARPELLEPHGLVYPELLTIPARDGFPMPAWILKPEGFDPTRPHPLILYVYGGPSAPTVRDAWTDDLWFDNLLVRQGYVVARCDHRASAAISKRLENLLHGRANAEVERDDYVDAVRWLKAQPWVDRARVGVWGWSGGGSMTLLLLTRSQEFRAGIAVAPVTDWRFYDTKWAETTMKTPAENPAGYAATDLVARAPDLHGRLLLVHGTYDDNVHPQNAWSFADALVAAGKPFDLMIYPMRKHGISDPPARVHLFGKMLEFWSLYL